MWMEDGEGKSSNSAELRAVWLVISLEPSPIDVYTDRWAVYWGWILRLPTWYHDNWLVGLRPLWRPELWQELMGLLSK